MLKTVSIPKPRNDYSEKTVGIENFDFKIKVNGQPVTCYSSRCSKVPFNRIYEGTQRNIEQSEVIGHVSFESDEPVTVEVETKKSFCRALVRPLSKNVDVKVENGKATFVLEKFGQYSLEFDDEHNSVSIFFNELKEFHGKEYYTHYFGAGCHLVGLLSLKSGDKVYVDKDAILFGGIYAKDADGIVIEGYGTINGKGLERIDRGFFNCGNIKMENCNDVKINGVIMQDSSFWVASFFDCSNIEINNVKITGQWRYNTDGIDLVNCKNVILKNSFIHAFDDVVVIKAYSQFEDVKNEVVENIIVKDCVLWCNWGRTIEIGIETVAKEYKNITFTNCDLIHNSASAIDVQNGDCASIHDLTIENVNVELQKSTMPEIYQETLEQVYDGYGKIGMPYLIWIDNHKYKLGNGFTAYDKKLKEFTGGKNVFGNVYDVVIKNINVYAEDGLPKLKIKIFSHDEENSFKDITIKNVMVNGKQAKLDMFDAQIDERIKNLSIFD